jgi:predicted enzyme related to lactoylglutathione lyase
LTSVTRLDAIGIPSTDWERSRQFYVETQAIALLHVDDVETARAELEAKGVEFVGETVDTSVCHMATFRDPDGNQLVLHKRYAPYA